MKKQIFIALLSLFSLIGLSNTQSDTTILKPIESSLKSIPDSLDLTFKDVYKDIKSGLQGLGSALKVGSEHVYQILIKQQYIMSITLIIVIFICLICSIISYNWGKRIHDKFKKDNPHSSYNEWDEGRWCLFYIIGIVLSVSALIISIATINIIITGLMNPEYGAIKDVINFIK